MIVRQKISELRERITEPRRFIQVLAGARQIGKTTLIKQLVAHLDLPYTFVSADAVDEEDRLWIPQQWQAARTEMRLRQADDYL
ncbi:MAG: AAA family ATPase, partial [Paludibacteraceae bacterium]